jgi:hypothetical protein
MGKRHNEQETYAREMGLDQRVEYDASGNAIYVGRAFPGAGDSEAKWQIYKMQVDANGNMTHLRWADNNDEFNKIWNSRSSYNFTDI